MYSIVGSGFGLYGYLPAIIRLHKKGIVLPEKYRETVLSRKELREFDQDITWVKNRDEALAKATDLVMAVPPNIQYNLVKKIIKETKIRYVYLEKPIAPTVEKSIELLKFLDLNEVSYIIGYSFCYLNLQENFSRLMGEKQDIYWHWGFMAHHFSMDLDNWKRRHKDGGGVLRFYGIHVIALLSLLGYKDVMNSVLIEARDNEPHTWKASILGDGLPICHVVVDSKSNQNVFNVFNKKNANIVSLKDPFDLVTEKLGRLDTRVSVLSKILSTELYKSYKLKSVYANINKLWEKIERVTNTINME